MRLIATFLDGQKALNFSSFLSKEGIPNSLESAFNSEQKEVYHLWIFSEDDLSKAEHWLNEYQKDEHDLRFVQTSSFEEKKVEKEAAEEASEGPLNPPLRKSPLQITHLVIFICTILFLWDCIQSQTLKEEIPPFAKGEITVLTPLEQALFFDVSRHTEEVQIFYRTELKGSDTLSERTFEKMTSIEKIPEWQGIYPLLTPEGESVDSKNAPLFEKIKKGEIWRFFTPCLLHGNFFHLLFNMMWVWAIGLQVEQRIGKLRFILLMVLIGIVANTAQYLMGGPFFLGYSGVVVGIVGFIWTRQRRAPWEGYPLQRPVILFLLFFILAMLLLQLLGYILTFFHIYDFAGYIANTDHLVGGIVGMGLGRLSFFRHKRVL